jgi:hypothetical protein
MSHHSELRAGAFSVESTKNDIEPTLMALFVPSDKQTKPIDIREWIEMEGEEEYWKSAYAHVHYTCSPAAMKDRLDLLGFTLEAATMAFTYGISRDLRRTEQRVADYEASIQNGPSSVLKSKPEAAKEATQHCVRMLKRYRKRVDALTRMTLDLWLSGLREVRQLGLTANRYHAPDNCDFVIEYILGGERWGFPGTDSRFLLRLLLETCEPNDIVDYDLTDLILGDQFESSADMIAYAEYLINREHEVYRRIIVLTEGASDKWILEKSLHLLYPHLSDFFSFMDFRGARIEGGAGALANLVKAFAGAGVSNRVVAVFDNDTAGRSALQSLQQIRLPENIVVMKLPHLPLAELYPTQGPTGISFMDINGLACSIELYLGSDVLKTDDGNYRPIEWRGLDVKLRQYQGEILEKDRVQDLFRSKLAMCEEDSSKISQNDWTGMELVLADLRAAFQGHDSTQHLEAEQFYANDEPSSEPA